MIQKALNNLYPNAKWMLNGETLDGLIWHEDNTQAKPSIKDLENEISRLQAEYDAKEYARKRAPEYPPIGDQLDALFKAGAFPADMAAKIQAVKDKYPKA